MSSGSEPGRGGSGLAVGVLVITASTYLTYALGLIVNVVVARSLGPADFGRYVYVVWLSGWMVLLINNGLTTSAIRFVSEMLGTGAPRAARRAHGHLLRLSHRAEVVVLGVFAVASLVVRPVQWEGALGLFILVTMASAASKSRFLFDVSVAKGYALFRIEAYTNAGIGALGALLVLALSAFHAGLPSYLLAFAVSSVAYWICAALQLRRAGVDAESGPLDPDLRRRMHVHLGWTLVTVAFGIVGNKNIEIFLLNAGPGPVYVGYFALAAALTRGGIDLLTSGLTTVLMPVMASAFGRGGETDVGRVLYRSVRYFAFAGLVAAGTGSFVAWPAIMLMYGPSYAPAVPAFQAMVVVAGLTLAESSFNALWSTTDRQRSRAFLVGLQVVGVALAAMMLIPRYGLNGAIAAHVVSRTVSYALGFIWAARTGVAKPPLTALLRLLLAGATASLIAYGLLHGLGAGGIAHVVAGAAYAMTLLPASLVFRCWDESDFDLANRLLGRHLPGAPSLQSAVVALKARFGV
jgi:O-antigen/teichoic acid export membrane protein